MNTHPEAFVGYLVFNPEYPYFCNGRIIPPTIVGVGFTHAQAHPNNYATTFTGML